jgi:hypothetical protein
MPLKVRCFASSSRSSVTVMPACSRAFGNQGQHNHSVVKRIAADEHKKAVRTHQAIQQGSAGTTKHGEYAFTAHSHKSTLSPPTVVALKAVAN